MPSWIVSVSPAKSCMVCLSGIQCSPFPSVTLKAKHMCIHWVLASVWNTLCMFLHCLGSVVPSCEFWAGINVINIVYCVGSKAEHTLKKMANFKWFMSCPWWYWDISKPGRSVHCKCANSNKQVSYHSECCKLCIYKATKNTACYCHFNTTMLSVAWLKRNMFLKYRASIYTAIIAVVGVHSNSILSSKCTFLCK